MLPRRTQFQSIRGRTVVNAAVSCSSLKNEKLFPRFLIWRRIDPSSFELIDQEITSFIRCRILVAYVQGEFPRGCGVVPLLFLFSTLIDVAYESLEPPNTNGPQDRCISGCRLWDIHSKLSWPQFWSHFQSFIISGHSMNLKTWLIVDCPWFNCSSFVAFFFPFY